MISSAFFAQSGIHKLLVVERIPKAPSAIVVIAQAFAEEMNKSRHMLALTASALYARGIGSVIFDYTGTGDSEGDFADATLAGWAKDLMVVTRLVQGQYSVPLVWLCHRTGALVGLKALSESQSAGIPYMIFWQPVLNGKLFIRQFFRLKLAENMMNSGAAKLTTEDIRNELATGSTEIAGYLISQQLFDEFESLETGSLLPNLAGKAVAWFEVVNKEEPTLLPVSLKSVQHLQTLGVKVAAEAVSGDQFWATQEINVASALVEQTVTWTSEQLHVRKTLTH